MIYTSLTKKAMQLCFEKHKEQLDKSGIPYPFHPFLLVSSMKRESTTCVALLHDSIEDTNMTAEDLLAHGFTNEIVEAITLLTHLEKDSYQDYVKKIGENEIARTVKIADLKHNSMLTRLEIIQENEIKRIEKYAAALAYLTSLEKPKLEVNQPRYILHTVHKERWIEDQNKKFFGQQDLKKSGFLHCSTFLNYAPIAERYRNCAAEMLLLVLDTTKLVYDVTYEDIKGRGECYPHIYGLINQEAVVEIFELMFDKKGKWKRILGMKKYKYKSIY